MRQITTCDGMDNIMQTTGNYMYLADYTITRAMDVRQIDGSAEITFDPEDLPDGIMLTVDAEDGGTPEGTTLIMSFPGAGELTDPTVLVRETKPTFVRISELSALNGIGTGEVIAVWLDN